MSSGKMAGLFRSRVNEFRSTLTWICILYAHAKFKVVCVCVNKSFMMSCCGMIVTNGSFGTYHACSVCTATCAFTIVNFINLCLWTLMFSHEDEEKLGDVVPFNKCGCMSQRPHPRIRSPPKVVLTPIHGHHQLFMIRSWPQTLCLQKDSRMMTL